MLYRVLLSLGLESEYVVCANATWLNDTAIAPESTTGKNFLTIYLRSFESPFPGGTFPVQGPYRQCE
jgi:hypothetical protein